MIYGPPVWASWLAAGVIVFLSLLMGGTEQQPPTEPITLRLPDGLTSHLENPQVFVSRDGTIFAATRPSSGVGGLVWRVDPNGTTTIIWAYDPDTFYALGELNINQQNGYLYYATVPKGDHTLIINYPVPGWVP